MSDRTDRKRPNMLVIMSDEHDPMCSSTYGHPLVETPHMDRLARQGATFDGAYCNSPLCVPSRISFVTGKYVSNVGGWDNATPLPVDAMTWAYLLRSKGYEAVLCGKMHLIGPDQLHGFERQLATDLHAENRHAIFRWKEGISTAPHPWASVLQAGPGTTREIEVDDEVEGAAIAYLRDRARRERPFALCVGPIAPHFPFVVPEPYFSRYYPDRCDLPNLPEGHLEGLPPAAHRLQRMFGLTGYTDDQILRARAAYYGLVSYLDDKIGRLLDVLKEEGLAENTVVIHTSDHGEMLGEHGLWRKMNFYEQAARVPLQISWPGVLPANRRISQCVSLVDLTATILDLGGFSVEERAGWELDGESLVPLLTDEDAAWKDEVFSEYTAHGTDRPRAMIRSGKWKLCYSHGHPPEWELYDLESDPGEFDNLAGQPAYRDILEDLTGRILEQWGDPERLEREIVNSQETRHLLRAVSRDKPF